MSKRKPKRCWSKSIGERGYRVRLYEARPGGTIMRSVYVNGKEARKSLGHHDKQLAIQHAYELLHALFANETAIEDESLTVGLLENLYIESPKHLSKKDRTQREDALHDAGLHVERPGPAHDTVLDDARHRLQRTEWPDRVRVPNQQLCGPASLPMLGHGEQMPTRLSTGDVSHSEA